MYRVHGAGWHSATAVLSPEQRLLEAAAVPATAPLDPEIFTAMIAARGTGLDEGQVELARHFATTEALLAVGVGPAGAGKTKAMGEFADLVRGVGERVVAVAPSAVAAQGLGDDIRAEATTVAKLLHTAEVDGIDATGLAAGDVLLVDEAGMASTGDLDRLVALARSTGSVVRLLGDPSQLSAVEAGGAFRLLVHRTPAAELTALHRFSDPAEAAASLALRAGNSDAVDFYEDTSRLHGGTRDGLLEQLYNDWAADQAAGLSSLMLAGDTATVRELSVRARLDRVAAGEVAQSGQRLHDGTIAGVGDRVVTRRNDRRLATAGGGDFVKNGDLWTVVETRPDGAMLVQHLERGGVAVLLPAEYANAHVELGYALTVHRAQGMTVDVSRSLVTDATTRETGYVAGTRGRHANHFYCVTEDVVDVDLHHPTADDQTPRQVMEAMLGRDAAERSAHETITDAFEAAESLAALIPEYDDARGAAAANTAHLDELLTTAFGHGQVTAMRNDPAWHALTARLGELDQADIDLQSLMPSVAGDLNDARNPAAVAAWRLEQRHPTTRGLEQWLTAPDADHAHDRRQELGQVQERGWEPSGAPMGGQGGDPMSRWLDDHATRIRARIDELERRAHDTQKPWLATLGDTPEAGTPAAAAHRDAVRAIAAYRERYAITITSQPLGYEPTDGQQQRDWRTVNTIIEHRTTLNERAVPAGPNDLLTKFQDLAASSRSSQPPLQPTADRTQQQLERERHEQAQREHQERNDNLER